MRGCFGILIGFLLIPLFTACNPEIKRQKIIRKLQDKNDPYILALKIGVYVHDYPDDLDQLSQYARLLLTSGYFTECRHLCNQILKVNPNDNYTVYTQAMAYRQSLEYGESISRFKRLLALLPADSAISSDYRRTLVQAGLYRDIQWCDSLIRVSGMRFDIILHRADLLLKMGKGKAAMADYALVLDSAGYDRDASFNRFRAAVLTSLPDEAEKEIERTKMNIPRDDPFIAQLSAILADTRSGLQKINESPAAPEGYVLMAKSLVFLKMETESIPYLEKALSLDKQNAQLMLRLAYVYILSGRGDEAKILVRQVSDRGLRIPDELQKMLR